MAIERKKSEVLQNDLREIDAEVERLMRKLEEIKNLSKENDALGFTKPTEKTVESAEYFIMVIPYACLKSGAIFPTYDNGVIFMGHMESATFSIYIKDDKFAFYIRPDNTMEKVSYSGDIGMDFVLKFREGIRKTTGELI